MLCPLVGSAVTFRQSINYHFASWTFSFPLKDFAKWESSLPVQVNAGWMNWIIPGWNNHPRSWRTAALFLARLLFIKKKNLFVLRLHVYTKSALRSHLFNTTKRVFNYFFLVWFVEDTRTCILCMQNMLHIKCKTWKREYLVRLFFRYLKTGFYAFFGQDLILIFQLCATLFLLGE